jgi:hypothetical protein
VSRQGDGRGGGCPSVDTNNDCSGGCPSGLQGGSQAARSSRPPWQPLQPGGWWWQWRRRPRQWWWRAQQPLAYALSSLQVLGHEAL